MIDYDLFNSNIAQVETIISSNYHFRFIDLSGDDIGNYDMMMSIVQARVITEGICRFIVLQEHLVKDERSLRAATLKAYVDDMLRLNLIVPKPIITYLTTIQKKSNSFLETIIDIVLRRTTGASYYVGETLQMTA